MDKYRIEAGSGVTTKHPQFIKYCPRWHEMEDALDEQDTIRDKDEKYLPMTSGMKGTDGKGNERYDAYKNRARWYGITRQTLTSIVGLMFEKDPNGASDDIVTRSGQTNIQLSRDVARDVTSFGRSILVVDAPLKGGEPFIVRYHPKALINWKLNPDNPAEFLKAVFVENVPDPDSTDEYSHDTVARYRVYRNTEGKITVTVYDEKEAVIEKERPLTVDKIPVIAIGSISVDPDCDSVPLQPVANCAVAIYQISADLRQDLYTTGQKQPWLKGLQEPEYKAVIETGYGAGGVWSLPADGDAGLLESTGSAYESANAERGFEFDQAATYAVKMTQQGNSSESGRALEIRAAGQHASIYTMADSISIGITGALQIRAKWAAITAPEDFSIRTEFTSEEAADQLIQALNSAINSSNAGRSIIFEMFRRMGLTEKTDEEQQKEIDSQMPAGALTPPIEPTVEKEKPEPEAETV